MLSIPVWLFCSMTFVFFFGGVAIGITISVTLFEKEILQKNKQ